MKNGDRVRTIKQIESKELGTEGVITNAEPDILRSPFTIIVRFEGSDRHYVININDVELIRTRRSG